MMIYQENIEGMDLPNLSNDPHFTCNTTQKLPVMLLTNLGLQNKAVIQMLACRVGFLAVRQFDLLAPKEQARVRDFLGGHFSKIQHFLINSHRESQISKSHRGSQRSKIKKKKKWMKLVNSYEITTAQGLALAKFIQGKAFCCVVAPNKYFKNKRGEILLSYMVKMTPESAKTLEFAERKFKTGSFGQGRVKTIKVEMISELAWSQLNKLNSMEKEAEEYISQTRKMAQIAGVIVAVALLCFFRRYYYGNAA